MKRLLALLALSLAACAHPHHVATVATTTTASLVWAAEDTERALRCGAPGAPQPPLCVDQATHVKARALFKRAYTVENGVGDALNLTDGSVPLPPELADLLAQILALLPESPVKTVLAAKVKR